MLLDQADAAWVSASLDDILVGFVQSLISANPLTKEPQISLVDTTTVWRMADPTGLPGGADKKPAPCESGKVPQLG